MNTSALTLVIGSRFGGPPGSANGGYAAGRLAAWLTSHVDESADAPVTVTLRRPLPLDTPLEVMEAETRIDLMHDGELVAEAAFGQLRADAVAPVSLAAAGEAQSSYAGLSEHPFPTCFVCGTARSFGDGLRLKPGRLEPGRTACVWRPDDSLAQTPTGPGLDNELVAPEFVWSALDCPGGWTSDLDARPLVLGRMTAWCDRLPPVGHECVVVGQLHATEGRKTRSATALYDGDGELFARAEHVWIAIDPADFGR